MDCLASTGLPVEAWIVAAVVLLAAGGGAWWFAFRRRRRAASTLGFVLLLVLGVGAAGSVHASPAQAMDGSCSGVGSGAPAPASATPMPSAISTSPPVATTSATPAPSGSPTTAAPTPTPVSTPPATTAPRVDLTPVATVDPIELAMGVPTRVDYAVRVENTGTAPSSGPVLVSIDKPVEAVGGVSSVAGRGWSFKSVPLDTTHVWVEYDDPIPPGAVVTFSVFFEKVTLTTKPVSITAAILAGTGGDMNPANDSCTASIRLAV